MHTPIDFHEDRNSKTGSATGVRRERSERGLDLSLRARAHLGPETAAESAEAPEGGSHARCGPIAGFGGRRHWQTPLRVLCCALILLSSACAVVEPVNTQPFLDYQSAVSGLKDSSDKAIEAVYQEEFDQFKADIASGETSDVRQLMLEFPPGSEFGWTYPGTNGQPIYISIANMRETLAAMNQHLLDYIGLLLTLAGADKGTGFDASAQAEKFDNDASALLQRLDSLGVGVSDVDSRDMALFSTVAANLASAYLENKRVELLTEILNEGLDPLQSFVDKAQAAMVLTADNAKTRYQDARMAPARAVATDGNSTALEKLLALNEQITQRLALYKSIHDGYGALPNAQRQIISAVKGSRNPGLGELLSYVADVRQQFEDLEDSSGNQPPGD